MGAVLGFLSTQAGQWLVITIGGAAVAYISKRSARGRQVLEAAETTFGLVEEWSKVSGASGGAKQAKFFAVMKGILASKNAKPLSESEMRALATRFLSARAAAPKAMPVSM